MCVMLLLQVKAMIEMINTMVLPTVKKVDLPPTLIASIEGGVAKLEKALKTMEEAESPFAMSKASRVARLEVMEEVRAFCDEAEMMVPTGTWPIASYKELLFLDFTEKYTIA